MDLKQQLKRLKTYQNCRKLNNSQTRNKKKTPREKMLIASRRKLVFDLRVKGKSYRQIAKSLGVSQVQVFNDIKRITEQMEEKTRILAARDRQIELTRLDGMLNSLEPKLRRGDEYAIDRALKIMAQRAKYIPGYEEPNKLLLGGDKDNPIELELAQQEVLETLRRLAPEYYKKKGEEKE